MFGPFSVPGTQGVGDLFAAAAGILHEAGDLSLGHGKGFVQRPADLLAGIVEKFDGALAHVLQPLGRIGEHIADIVQRGVDNLLLDFIQDIFDAIGRHADGELQVEAFAVDGEFGSDAGLESGLRELDGQVEADVALDVDAVGHFDPADFDGSKVQVDIEIKAQGAFEGGFAALAEQFQHQADAEYRAFDARLVLCQKDFCRCQVQTGQRGVHFTGDLEIVAADQAFHIAVDFDGPIVREQVQHAPEPEDIVDQADIAGQDAVTEHIQVGVTEDLDGGGLRRSVVGGTDQGPARAANHTRVPVSGGIDQQRSKAPVHFPVTAQAGFVSRQMAVHMALELIRAPCMGPDAQFIDTAFEVVFLLAARILPDDHGFFNNGRYAAGRARSGLDAVDKGSGGFAVIGHGHMGPLAPLDAAFGCVRRALDLVVAGLETMADKSVLVQPDIEAAAGPAHHTGPDRGFIRFNPALHRIAGNPQAVAVGKLHAVIPAVERQAVGNHFRFFHPAGLADASVQVGGGILDKIAAALVHGPAAFQAGFAAVEPLQHGVPNGGGAAGHIPDAHLRQAPLVKGARLAVATAADLKSRLVDRHAAAGGAGRYLDAVDIGSGGFTVVGDGHMIPLVPLYAAPGCIGRSGVAVLAGLEPVMDKPILVQPDIEIATGLADDARPCGGLLRLDPALHRIL